MKRIFFAISLIFPLLFFGQNEFKKWYFGRFTGLDFMTVPPTVINHSTMNTFEGSASIADAQGNLLFYTDGITVWNQLQQVMANGTGLLGSSTSVQSAIVIQKPGDACLYYLFTQDGQGGANGLMYSVVDMCAASGNGSVTTKNVPLHTPCTEHLAAVRHCNGTDAWVVAHDFNSNTFLSYLVTSAGVNTTPVSSATGPTVSLLGQGTLKFSPNGKKMGFTGFNWTPKTVTLFDFDRATGTVSNSLTVLSTTNVNCYGCEFSPDNSKFYTCGSSLNSGVLQWNLCAGSSSAIIASQTTVGSTIGSGQLQLAPNGQIYVVQWGKQMLDAIGNPDGLGTACNFSTNVQSVATGSNGTGLPNFITGVYKNLPPFTYTLNPLISCATVSFTAPPPVTYTNVGCSSTSYSFSSISWDFGHPGSGSANTSTLSNPNHDYGSPGTYYPKLLIHYACGTDTVRDTVVIPGPVISMQSAGINCSSAGTATVFVTGGSGQFTYTWSPGSSTSSVSPVTPGPYTVAIQDLNGGCTYSLNHIFSPPTAFSGTITQTKLLLCFGHSTAAASLAVTPGTGGPSTITYSWSNGQTAATLSNVAAGSYTVHAQNGMCSITKTIQILQPPPLTASVLVPAIEICANRTLALSAIGSGGTPTLSYAWSGGQNTAQSIHTITSSGTFTNQVTVTDKNGCTATATIGLNVSGNPMPAVQNATVCTNTMHTFTATGTGSFNWTPGNVNTPTMAVKPISNTVYTVTTLQTNGCSSSATVSLFVMSCIGLDEFDHERRFSIFPNPVSDVVTISNTEETAIVIKSAEGHIVYTATLKPGVHKVPVNDWPNGVYLVSAKTRSGETNQKVIVGD